MEEDFNTPEAFAVFFNFIKFLNTGIREKLFCKSELVSMLELLKTFDQIL
jgi:DALR domain